MICFSSNLSGYGYSINKLNFWNVSFLISSNAPSSDRLATVCFSNVHRGTQFGVALIRVNLDEIR